MDLNLKDRVAVITGGAAGIGEAIARQLAAEGCNIFILDRDEVLLANQPRRSRKRSASAICRGRCWRLRCCGTCLCQIAAAHNGLDILVNAAGVLSTGLVADLPTAEWQRVSEINLSGVIYCAKAAIPFMSRKEHGRIINIASVSAMRGGGSVGNTLYGATKAGVVALTMGLARELGPHAITVNSSHPPLPIPR